MKKLYRKLSIVIMLFCLFNIINPPMKAFAADTIVNFADPYLQEFMCSWVNKSQGSTIYLSDLQAGLTAHNGLLYISSIDPVISTDILKIHNLDGLQALQGLNITSLNLDQLANIDSLSPISNLISLQKLYCQSHGIVDISPLAKLTNLKELYLVSNQIVDITPLSNLINLTTLWINGNKITDISPLSGLINLTNVAINDNYITDFTPLTGAAPNFTYFKPTNNFADAFNPPNLAITNKTTVASQKSQNRYGFVTTPVLGDLNFIDSVTVKVGQTITLNSWIVTNYALNRYHGADPDLDTTVLKPSNYNQTFNMQDTSIATLSTANPNHPIVTGTVVGITQLNTTILGGLGPFTTHTITVNVIPADIKGNITIKYQDENGTDIGTPDVLSNLDMGSYTENAKSFTGYNLNDSSSKTVTLIDSNPNQTIIFGYKKVVVPPPVVIKGSITVKYQDENVTDLQAPDILNNLDLGTYTRNAKNFLGYTLNDSGTKSVDLTDSTLNQTIIFSYKKDFVPPVIKGNYTAQFIDQDEKILEQETTSSLDLANYTIQAKRFDGYTLNDESNKVVILTIDNPNQTIVFKYKKIETPKPVIKGSITIKYQDEAGKDIIAPELLSDLDLSSYTEKAKSFDGYTLDGSESQSVTLTEDSKDQVIIFKYKKSPTLIVPVMPVVPKLPQTGSSIDDKMLVLIGLLMILLGSFMTKFKFTRNK